MRYIINIDSLYFLKSTNTMLFMNYYFTFNNIIKFS